MQTLYVYLRDKSEVEGADDGGIFASVSERNSEPASAGDLT